MEKNNLKIKTLPLSIKVIEVNNKKMTISVFNQIPNKNIVNASIVDSESFSDCLIGWVSRSENKEKYLLFVFNNILYKKCYSVGFLQSEFEKEKVKYSTNELITKNINKLEFFLEENNNQVYIAV